MKSVLKNKYLIVLALVFFILLVWYRYSAKRIEHFGHYNKVWAHRVNDFKKLKSAENNFEGIEIDIMFNEDQEQLWVSHGKLTSSPKLLSDYLDQVRNKELNFWFDVKNLKKSNSKKLFNKFEAVLGSKNLSQKKAFILIESTDVLSLKPFIKAGYRTSWYITDTLTTANQQAHIELISEGLTHKNIELSSDYRNYPILAEAFPKRTKNFWILTSTYDNDIINNFSLIRKLLADSSVKTVLVPYVNFNRHFN